jgi:hypothetical protein
MGWSVAIVVVRILFMLLAAYVHAATADETGTPPSDYPMLQ